MGLSDLTNRQMGLVWFLLSFTGFLLGMFGILFGSPSNFFAPFGLILILAAILLRIPSLWAKGKEVRLWSRFISNSMFVFGGSATLAWILIIVIATSRCVNGEC